MATVGFADIATTTTTSTTLSPLPTTPKNVTSDMKRVIEAVGTIECPESVRKNTFAIYKNNRVLFDACTRASKYQLLPHEAGVPTPAQTAALVITPACVDLFSGILLANFPECDIDGFSIRAAVEALFRIRKDVLAGRGAPTQRQFDEFYSLNRVVNLLAENATLIETILAQQAMPTRVSLTEMTRLLNRIEVDPAVSISDDMTISIASVRGKDTTSSGGGSNSSDAMSTTGSTPVMLPSSAQVLKDESRNSSTGPTSSAARQRTSTSFSRLLHVALVVALCVWRC